MSAKNINERVADPKHQKQWAKSRENAVKQLIDEEGNMKRQQIDTWAVVDDLGLTVHEFRLLYSIARHERWNTLQGGHKKKFINGCYASAQTLSNITGISRNKVFEVLDILRAANIIEKLAGDDGKPKGRGKKGRNQVSLAGWTYEYRILPISQWANPTELLEVREKVLNRRKASKSKN